MYWYHKNPSALANFTSHTNSLTKFLLLKTNKKTVGCETVATSFQQQRCSPCRDLHKTASVDENCNTHPSCLIT